LLPIDRNRPPDETGRHERGGGSFYHRTQFDSIGDADLGSSSSMTPRTASIPRRR